MLQRTSMLQRFTKLLSSATDHPKADGHRLEVKFVLPARMLSDARVAVLIHPSGFIPAYHPRQINNVYFDSESLDLLRMNESEVSTRFKLRIRWYDDLRQASNPVLELKFKSGVSGWKLRHQLPGDFDLAKLRWSYLRREVRRSLPPAMLPYANFTARPVVLNSYQREYFATVDGRLRVTIDHSIRSFDQRLSARPNWLHSTPAPDMVVVEMKASVEDEAAVRDAAPRFAWRLSRNSKYARGLQPAFL